MVQPGYLQSSLWIASGSTTPTASTVIRANPLTEPEQAQLDRARAGDVAGLLTRDQHGSRVRL